MRQVAKHADILITIGVSLGTILLTVGSAYTSTIDTLAAHTKELDSHAAQIQQVNVRTEEIKDDTNILKQASGRQEQKIDDMADNINDMKQWMRSINDRLRH